MGLSCGTQDLWSLLWHVRSLLVACGIFSCSMQTLSWSMWDLVPWPGIEPWRPETTGSTGSTGAFWALEAGVLAYGSSWMFYLNPTLLSLLPVGNLLYTFLLSFLFCLSCLSHLSSSLLITQSFCYLDLPTFPFQRKILMWEIRYSPTFHRWHTHPTPTDSDPKILPTAQAGSSGAPSSLIKLLTFSTLSLRRTVGQAH